jgi:hypothetical protein
MQMCTSSLQLQLVAQCALGGAGGVRGRDQLAREQVLLIAAAAAEQSRDMVRRLVASALVDAAPAGAVAALAMYMGRLLVCQAQLPAQMLGKGKEMNVASIPAGFARTSDRWARAAAKELALLTAPGAHDAAHGARRSHDEQTHVVILAKEERHGGAVDLRLPRPGRDGCLPDFHAEAEYLRKQTWSE